MMTTAHSVLCTICDISVEMNSYSPVHEFFIQQTNYYLFSTQTSFGFVKR